MEKIRNINLWSFLFSVTTISIYPNCFSYLILLFNMVLGYFDRFKLKFTQCLTLLYMGFPIPLELIIIIYEIIDCFYVYSIYMHKGRQRQRERHRTKRLMSKIMALHVRYKSLYLFSPSSAKQQREMTKLWVLWGVRHDSKFFASFELIDGITNLD